MVSPCLRTEENGYQQYSIKYHFMILTKAPGRVIAVTVGIFSGYTFFVVGGGISAAGTSYFVDGVDTTITSPFERTSTRNGWRYFRPRRRTDASYYNSLISNIIYISASAAGVPYGTVP